MRRLVEVLVVDDSEQDAALTLDALRRAAPGAKLLRLTDGEQALHYICATDGYAGRPVGLPKLVLMDLHMPGMDGIAVLKVLRERSDTRHMPVVLWSSNSNHLFVDQALQAGASAYHVKPTALDAYRDEIDQIAQRWLHEAAIPEAIPAVSTSKRSA